MVKLQCSYQKRLHIVFSTHDGKVVSEDIEYNAVNNINRWLEQASTELIEAGAKVELYIDEFNIQHLSIECDNIELKEKAYKALKPHFPH